MCGSYGSCICHYVGDAWVNHGSHIVFSGHVRVIYGSHMGRQLGHVWVIWVMYVSTMDHLDHTGHDSVIRVNHVSYVGMGQVDHVSL